MTTTPSTRTTLTAHYDLVTPAFMGDGDGKSSFAIRPPSIKGLLRFWWRAAAWARFRASAETDAAALRALHAREAHLFGQAAHEGGGGQGVFLLDVEQDNFEPLSDKRGRGIAAARYLPYLLGQGLWGAPEHLKKDPLREGSFSVHCTIKRGVPVEDTREIARALWFFGAFGGIGARTRRGWGSVSLSAPVSLADKPFEAFTPISRCEDFADAVAGMLPDRSKALLPPFSAFSALTRSDISVVSKVNASALDLLNEVGEQLLRYRSNGRRTQSDAVHRVFEIKAEKTFCGDRKILAAVSNCQGPVTMQRRSVFGLPHNAYLANMEEEEHKKKRQIAVDALIGGDKLRRASPLFIHVHKLADERRCGVIQTLFEATFLPKNATVRMKDTRSGPEGEFRVTPTEDWAVITNYLDRERFKDAKRVLEPLKEPLK
jgi:CRISPR-associated protein Cmr1